VALPRNRPAVAFVGIGWQLSGWVYHAVAGATSDDRLVLAVAGLGNGLDRCWTTPAGRFPPPHPGHGGDQENTTEHNSDGYGPAEAGANG